MDKYTQNLLLCQKCKIKLRIFRILSDGCAIFQCQCNQYILIRGILLLKTTNQVVIESFKRGRFNKAVGLLCSSKFIPQIFFRIIASFPSLFKTLGFKSLIKMLGIISREKKWFAYLGQRERSSSFIIALAALNIIKKSSEKIIDVGCGTGNFFPHFYKHAVPKNVIGIDQSFLNLFLARLFFAKKETLLVCTDLEKGLPLKKGSITRFFLIDMFYDIKNKFFLLKELKRCLVKNGSIRIIQMVNQTQKAAMLNIKGVRPYVIRKMITKVGWKNFALLSNGYLLSRSNKQAKIYLAKDPHLDKSYAYNIFIANNKLQ